MTFLAVFRSRSQTMDFVGRLLKYGISAKATSTPKEAKIGCGLCVKFDSTDFIRVKAVLAMNRYSSFKGFYRIDYANGVPSAVLYTD